MDNSLKCQTSHHLFTIHLVVGAASGFFMQSAIHFWGPPWDVHHAQFAVYIVGDLMGFHHLEILSLAYLINLSQKNASMEILIRTASLLYIFKSQ